MNKFKNKYCNKIIDVVKFYLKPHTVQQEVLKPQSKNVLASLSPRTKSIYMDLKIQANTNDPSDKKHRIVMDLQPIQVDFQAAKIKAEVLELVAKLASRDDVELLISLNGQFINETLAVRKLLCNTVPTCNINTWFSVALSPNSIWYKKTAEFTREESILSFNPDVVIIPGLVAKDDPRFTFTAGSIDVPILAREDTLITVDLIDELNVTSLESLVAKDAPVSELVESILKFCKELTLASKSSQALLDTKSPPKLAFVSPLPPLKSGISFYSADLIPELSKYYDIDVITDQKNIDDEWVKNNCKILTPDLFLENQHLYERVIYQVGNNPMHAYMFDLMCIIPGLVILHDFYLGDLNYYMEHSQNRQFWLAKQLYHSHGYKALIDFSSKLNIHQLLAKYPSTAGIFSNAKGVVLHSHFAKQLAYKYYPNLIKGHCYEVPLFRLPAEVISKSNARELLNLKSSDFIVTSFGHIGRHKLNHCIIEAFLASAMSKNKSCHIIFVGENSADDYGSTITSMISKHNNISITGWVDEQTYKNYLAASDIAIQLRSESRGETSAAVLDCMNYGLATIVNNSGSMADLDPNGVLVLPYELDCEELVAALTNSMETLKKDVVLRRSLAERASSIIAEDHSLKECTKKYVDAIEQTQNVVSSYPGTLFERIAQLGSAPLSKAERVDTAVCIADSFPATAAKKRLFIDVSIVNSNNHRTDIQRAVRSIVIELINKELDEYSIEPVYLSYDGKRWHYRYAREWMATILGFSSELLVDEPIDLGLGDQLLILDFTSEILTKMENVEFYDRLRSNGITIKTVIHDLLPIKFSNFFPTDIGLEHKKWINAVLKLDGVLCISKSVAVEMRALVEKNEHFNPDSFPISYFQLGADIDNSSSTIGFPAETKKVIRNINKRITFLVVGVIEPGKGNANVLSAFKLLWNQKIDVNLIFVGKKGWLNDELIKTIKCDRHYRKNFFWLDGISDEYLEQIYKTSNCLIAGTKGEGFGLPLIEAAKYKLPIIARDITNFREIAGECAYYFNNESDSEMIADTIRNWLDLYEKNIHPKTDDMPWLTWEESAEQLLECLKIN